jgi:hypothetical protein
VADEETPPLRSTLDALTDHERDLAEVTLGWCDQWYDPDVGLPWAPDGHETIVALGAPRSLHIVQGAHWYAFGLLLRDGPGDGERAVRVLDALCDLQYDAAGTDWHGTFALFAESPEPPRHNPVMWSDYDPNWRQFCGSTFLAVLATFARRLPERLVDRLDRALRLAVEGEPPHRVPPSYSNIALLKAFVEVGAGTRLAEPHWVTQGEATGRAVADHVGRHGCFDEFNSPTYYGVDLLALALWRSASPSPVLADLGATMEAALWRDLARWWHAGLGNLCGPFTRAYGMEMSSYVAKLSLWLWAAHGRTATPLPELAPDAPHGHDLFTGAFTAALGTRIPDDVSDDLQDFTGPRTVRQHIDDDPRRMATGWLDDGVMVGAERCDADLSWWDQYFAATVHWRRPDGAVGWLAVRMPGASLADAGPGRLVVQRDPGAEGPAQITVHADVADVAALLAAPRADAGEPPPSGAVRTWELPGLTVTLAGAGELSVVGPAPADAPVAGGIVLHASAPQALTLTVVAQP